MTGIRDRATRVPISRAALVVLPRSPVLKHFRRNRCVLPTPNLGDALPMPMPMRMSFSLSLLPRDFQLQQTITPSAPGFVDGRWARRRRTWRWTGIYVASDPSWMQAYRFAARWLCGGSSFPKKTFEAMGSASSWRYHTAFYPRTGCPFTRAMLSWSIDYSAISSVRIHTILPAGQMVTAAIGSPMDTRVMASINALAYCAFGGSEPGYALPNGCSDESPRGVEPACARAVHASWPVLRIASDRFCAVDSQRLEHDTPSAEGNCLPCPLWEELHPEEPLENRR